MDKGINGVIAAGPRAPVPQATPSVSDLTEREAIRLRIDHDKAQEEIVVTFVELVSKPGYLSDSPLPFGLDGRVAATVMGTDRWSAGSEKTD
jgi:hypothetical protein